MDRWLAGWSVVTRRCKAGSRIVRKLLKLRLTVASGLLAPSMAYPFANREGGSSMAETVTRSFVQQFASMKPNEFGSAIEPKWQLGERLIKEVRTSVEKQHVTP